MWYFAWILGLGFAVLLSVVNVMWLEAKEDGEALAKVGTDGRVSSLRE
jgi:cyd operon protein YbgT